MRKLTKEIEDGWRLKAGGGNWFLECVEIEKIAFALSFLGYAEFEKWKVIRDSKYFSYSCYVSAMRALLLARKFKLTCDDTNLSQ